jgi:hypothetical protein
MTSQIVLSLVFAALAGSIAWQAGKRAKLYLKMGNDFMQATSTQATGKSLLFAGSLWGIGAFVFVALGLGLIGVAVYYVSLL